MPMPMQNLPCALSLGFGELLADDQKYQTLDGSGTSRGFPQAILRQFTVPNTRRWSQSALYRMLGRRYVYVHVPPR